MLHQRRLKFIYTQVGGMLGLIIVLELFDVLTLPRFYLLSYVLFAGLIYYFSMLSLPAPASTRLKQMLAIGGVGFIAISIWIIASALNAF